MHQPEQVIFSNMCMVQKGDNVLVQNRVDPHWPGVVFPGGHVEKGETFAQAVIREVREETGLTIRNPRLCGVKHWQDKGVRQMVLLYKATEFTGQVRPSQEGEVWWMPLRDMPAAPLASGMGTMLRVFLEEDISEYSFLQSEKEWIDVLE